MELYKVQKLLESGNSIYDLPLKVVYYARVSTDKDDQINSLSNQVFYYEDFIKRNKNWTFAGGYIDEGISGLKTDKRDRFLQMIEDAKEGNFDLIITKEISRFSRNTLDSINYTRELLKYGVGVLFQSDNINTLDKDSELRLTIMASIAQEESRKTSERLKFGYKRSIEQGRVLGREPYGYFKKDGKLSINEAEAQIVRYIYEEYIKGKLGLRTICKELEERGVLARNGKPFGYSVLQNIIKNPKYKGYYCGRKTTIPDYRTGKKKKLDESEWIVYKDENIPALVSEELWDKANELLKSRGEKFKEHDVGNQNRYTYSGKLFCAEHGCSYHRHVYKSKSGEKECWNCRLYRLKGKDKGCDSLTCPLFSHS